MEHFSDEAGLVGCQRNGGGVVISG
jgi:hypothetical protein